MESSRSEIDLGLLSRIVARDENALAEFYDRHSRITYSLIMRILDNASEAEDVLLETFERVWSRTDTYHAVLGSPGAWLVRIARNCAIDRLRARRAQENVVAVEPGGVAVGNRSQLVQQVTRDTPETVLENKMSAGAVRVALESLPPPQRELIEAAFFEGYTHNELAGRFGVPLGTVKTRIRAGMGALRDRLREEAV
jgi:RNA polymerase sigma-70 factor (ECF subfamily)